MICMQWAGKLFFFFFVKGQVMNLLEFVGLYNLCYKNSTLQEQYKSAIDSTWINDCHCDLIKLKQQQQQTTANRKELLDGSQLAQLWFTESCWNN